MGYFKRISAQLSRQEITIMKTGNKKAFNNLSMDRQGEILTILESCKRLTVTDYRA